MPDSSSAAPRSAPPYTVLAAGYDVVMEHVDYEAWAAYVHRLLSRHHAGVETVLELACGTGSLALEFQPLGGYRYLGTDRSEYMVRVARAKAEMEGAEMMFEVADFTDYRVEPTVDAVVLLYDSINYLLDEAPILALLDCTYRALRPGGIFVFDQSTPFNSLNNEAFFEDAGVAEGFSYARHSRYDPETRLHTTTLDLTIEGQVYREEHVERAYDLDEVRALVAQAGFEEVAAYDGFSTEPATDASERVHWVLRRPAG